MSVKPLVKICGIKDKAALEACIKERADFIGFVFANHSPRFLGFEQAQKLLAVTPPSIHKVALFVNPSNDEILKAKQIGFDFIQLHGPESPARVLEIKRIFEGKLIKAIGISTKQDLADIKNFEENADWILLDAKGNQAQEGGNGVSFDWNIVSGFKFQKPWMLSGGLNVQNIDKALEVLKPDAVDVSSGVEIRRGEKDPQKIKDFIEKIRYKN